MIPVQVLVSIGTIDEYMRFENFQWRRWVVPLHLQQIAMRQWMILSKKEGQFSALAIVKIWRDPDSSAAGPYDYR